MRTHNATMQRLQYKHGIDLDKNDKRSTRYNIIWIKNSVKDKTNSVNPFKDCSYRTGSGWPTLRCIRCLSHFSENLIHSTVVFSRQHTLSKP